MRSKGRKTKKPVKLSRQLFKPDGEEERGLTLQGEESHHYDRKQEESYHSGQDQKEIQHGGRDQEEIHHSAESLELNPDCTEGTDSKAIMGVKWDKRMRLTITKDFRKEKKQSLSGGLVTRDDRPAQRMFTCIICHQAFLHASDCYDHMCTHTDDSLPSQDREEDALNSGISEPDIKLEYDDAEDAEDLKSEDSGDRKSISCVEYDASCPDISSVAKHMEEVHPLSGSKGKKEYKCKPCQKTFYGKREFSRHNRQHSEEKNFVCPVCGDLFPTSSSLSLHKRNHAGHRPFKCSINGCDRAFPDLQSVNRHRRTHSDERPYVCTHCKKAFKMQNHLREHLRLHTGERPFVCEFCGAGFAQSNGLKSHAKQHSRERDNQCDVCHKAFSHPNYLTLHKKVHSGEKPFTCTLCDRTFSTAANLGAHKKLKHELLTRNGGKNFTCDICGACFSLACNLGIHKKKKHSGTPPSAEKNYVCEICNARFLEPCNLGAHKKIKHTEQSENGRNIFDCDICGAKFYRACNLSGHRRRKHGETGDTKNSDKLFVCSQCNLRLSTLENLQEHHSKIHFSMPPLSTESRSSFDTAESQPPSKETPDLASFRIHVPALSVESNLNTQHSGISQSIPESASVVFPNTVPPSIKSEKQSVYSSFVNPAECGPVSAESEQGRNSSKHKPVGVTPSGVSPDGSSYHQTVSTFECQLPVSSVPSQYNFSLGAWPSACQVCGVLVSDKQSMVQHLEMHSSEKFLQDIFSVQ